MTKQTEQTPKRTPTLSSFLRETRQRRVRLELIERDGNRDIPLGLRGAKRVVSATRPRIIVTDKYGYRTEIPLPANAKLFEFTEDGSEIRIYEPAERPLTVKEARVMLKWERIERFFHHQYPGASIYFKRQEFFANCGYPWLEGKEKISGKIYLPEKNVVVDESIRGKIKIRYRVT